MALPNVSSRKTRATRKRPISLSTFRMRNPLEFFQNQLLGSNFYDKNLRTSWDLRHTVQDFRIRWSTPIQVTMSRHVKTVTISQVQSFDVPGASSTKKTNKIVRFGPTYAQYHDLMLPTRGHQGPIINISSGASIHNYVDSRTAVPPCRRACAHTRTKADKPVEKTARSTIKNQCTAIAKSPRAE